MKILNIHNVNKYFQKELVLKNITLDIEEGSLFGFLGPNGAGKTTLIRCITQIIIPDSGKIIFNGEKLNPKHIIEMGYMPEERGLYKKMGVYDQLLYLSRLKGLSSKEAKSKIEFWLEKFSIVDWKSKKIEELSKGMGQKIQFIATVINAPKLLILDEPFSGLDPVNADLIQQEILALNREGTTIIFSTHRMEQVEQLCDKIVLINKGENILNGSVKEIIQENKENKYKITFSNDSLIALPENMPCNILFFNNHEFIFKLGQNQSTNGVIKRLLDSNIIISSLTEILPTIKEIFISKTTKNIANE